MRIQQLIVTLTAIGFFAAGCAESAAPKGSSKKGVDAKGEEYDDEGDGQAIELSKDAGFDEWCVSAGETAPAKGDLKSLFKELCNGSKATSLFKKSLLSVVYDGSGDTKLKSIVAMKSDKATKITSYRFGVTIKLPIDMETHFNKVGPKGGDVEAQQKVAEANGATAEVDIKKTYKKDGKHQVRGWLIYSKITKPGLIKIVTETESRMDQFEFDKGKSYMYTQDLKKGIQTVQKFDMMTAGIQDGDDAYLLTVVDVAVGNRGFAGEAEKQLRQTAADTVKAMYKAAQEAE